MPVPIHAPRQCANAIGRLVERVWKILAIAESDRTNASLAWDVPKPATNTAAVSTSSLPVPTLARRIATHTDHRYVVIAMPGEYGYRAFLMEVDMKQVPVLLLILVYIGGGETSHLQAQWFATDIPSWVHVFTITTADDYVFVGTDSALYVSADGGLTWTHPTNVGMVGNRSIYALAVKDSFLFAATATTGVFRSDDLGANWQSMNIGLPSGQYLSLLVGDSGIFLGTSKGVYLSTNNGITWQARNTGIQNRPVWELALDSSNSNQRLLFAGATGSRGGVYRSPDNGISWESVSHGWADSSIWALTVGYDSTIFAGTESKGVYYSTDHGLTWQQRGLANLSVQGLVVIRAGFNNQIVIAGTFDGGVFRSSNNGETWNEANDGLVSIELNALGSNENRVFAGLYSGGVWRTFYSYIISSVEDEIGATPPVYELGQNFPNPFNPISLIEYALPDPMYVILRVYNSLGQEVARLVDGNQEAGYRFVQFDANALPSGVYYYRLQAGSFTGVRKLILMR